MSSCQEEIIDFFNSLIITNVKQFVPHLKKQCPNPDKKCYVSFLPDYQPWINTSIEISRDGYLILMKYNHAIYGKKEQKFNRCNGTDAYFTMDLLYQTNRISQIKKLNDFVKEYPELKWLYNYKPSYFNL
jgi:hypothetical protein